MYFVSSSTALAATLLLASLCGQVSGFPRLFERQEAVCLDTPFLQGFYAEPEVATPYCYAFLGLPTITTTRTKTVRNSTATITSTSIRTTVTQITTVPSSSLTSTSIIIDDLRKRAPAPTPAIQMPAVILAAGGDPYLSASVSSACSCLFIDPSTTRIRTTVYATQTATAVLVEGTTSVITVTQGTSTIVTTITLYRSLPPASSTLTSSTSAAWSTSLNSTTSSASSAPSPISTIIPSTGAPFPTFNTTVIPSTGAPLPTLNSTVAPTTSAPFPTFNSTVVPSTGAPFPTSNSTIVRSSGTAPSVTITSFPPLNSSSFTGTGSFPPASINISSSISGSPTYPWYNSTSLPGTGSFPTTSSTPSLDTASMPANSTVPPSSTTVSPTAIPTEASNCPSADQTYYTARDSEQFQLYCDIVYSGDQTFGVIAYDIYACIEACTNANQGFSGLRCHGVTWYPEQDAVPNCFLKSTAQVKVFVMYTGTISALLLSPVLPGSNTTTNSTSIPPGSFSNTTTSIGPTAASPGTANTTMTSTTSSVPLSSTGPAIHIPTSSVISLPSISLPPLW